MKKDPRPFAVVASIAGRHCKKMPRVVVENAGSPPVRFFARSVDQEVRRRPFDLGGHDVGPGKDRCLIPVDEVREPSGFIQRTVWRLLGLGRNQAVLGDIEFVSLRHCLTIFSLNSGRASATRPWIT